MNISDSKILLKLCTQIIVVISTFKIKIIKIPEKKFDKTVGLNTKV